MRLEAPFSADEVMSLTEYQDARAWHPFTCTNEHEGNNELIPARTGWVCPGCGYVQHWCYTWMANWEWKAEWEAIEAHLAVPQVTVRTNDTLSKD